MDQVLGNDPRQFGAGTGPSTIHQGPAKGNIYLVYSNNKLEGRRRHFVFNAALTAGLSFTSPVPQSTVDQGKRSRSMVSLGLLLITATAASMSSTTIKE